jgi:hypothetical protein
MTRKMNKYKNLFDQYEILDEQQEQLYNKQIFLPPEKKVQWNELQIKKISILEEMEKCL